MFSVPWKAISSPSWGVMKAKYSPRMAHTWRVLVQSGPVVWCTAPVAACNPASTHLFWPVLSADNITLQPVLMWSQLYPLPDTAVWEIQKKKKKRFSTKYGKVNPAILSSPVRLSVVKLKMIVDWITHLFYWKRSLCREQRWQNGVLLWSKWGTAASGAIAELLRWHVSYLGSGQSGFHTMGLLFQFPKKDDVSTILCKWTWYIILLSIFVLFYRSTSSHKQVLSASIYLFVFNSRWRKYLYVFWWSRLEIIIYTFIKTSSK